MAVVVVVSLLAGCASESGSDPLEAERSAGTTESTGSEASGRTDLAVAKNAVLQPDDLPVEWTECCPPQIFDEDSLASQVCGSPSDLPARTAGYQRQYGRNTTGGVSDAFVVSAAVVASTAEVAAREFTGFDAASYEPCMVEDIDQAVRETHSAPVSDLDSTYSREEISLDVPATMDRFYSTFAITGDRAWLHFVVVRMRVDRVLIRLTFRNYTEPLDTASVLRIATALLGRLR